MKSSPAQIPSYLLLLALAACGSSPKPKATEPKADAIAKASHGSLRIETPNVVPVRYHAVLRLDPAESTFTGTLEAKLAIAEPATDFYLNGYGLKVANAHVAFAGERIPLSAQAEDDHWLHFSADRTLPVGDATLHVSYVGDVDSKSSFGVFRQQAADDWYVYTQFESRGARRAFPSLDQPDHKVPWQLSLEVPEAQRALTNSPEIGRENLGDGFVRVDFAESPPMPSYLVAFAVGPFDIVDIGTTRHGVPVRVIAPNGRGGETGWVQESTLPLLEILEDYTGIPYPYAKLDLISIPSTGSFGAMENPGLITYNETLLLSKDNDLNFKKRSASVQAHEFAHQWFGNLVTNAWWDDLWLNESFATWGAAKVMDTFNPEWRSDVSRIDSRNGAMSADSLASARVIHQPIEVEGDIGAAFDGITYAKGAAVLTMFEGWLGEETFQRGIQHYLGNNQWKSLKAEDFLSAMDVGTGQKVSQAFASFIDNPGTPVVSFALECNEGSAPVLSLFQERYKPLGSEISESPAYEIPLCVRYPTGKGKETTRECTVVRETTSKLVLANAQSCPAWIVPNDGGTGYYRAELSPPLFDALGASQALTTPERLVMASDIKALVWSGAAPLETMLALVPEMAASKDDALIASAVGLASLGRLVGTEDEGRYHRWLSKHFAKTARKLGWKTRRGEPSSRVTLRSSLLSLMIFQAQDTKLRVQGQKLAKAWLSNPESVDADVAELALKVAARYGDVELLDTFMKTVKGTSDRSRRRLLLSAMGVVSDPALVQHALAVMLDADLDVRESQVVLSSLAGNKESGHMALAFAEANWDSLIERYGEEMGTRLARVAGAQCDAAQQSAVESFLTRRIEPLPGGGRAKAQALERFQLCLAARQKLVLPAEL